MRGGGAAGGGPGPAERAAHRVRRAGASTRCCTCRRGSTTRCAATGTSTGTSPVRSRPAAAPEVWLRGRVLGGVAAVNGMMWMRGAPADWDGLAARGNPGWSWADVLPAYRAMEDHSLGASETPRRGRAARRLGHRPRRRGHRRHPGVGGRATAGSTSPTPTPATPSGSASPRRRSARGRRTTSYDAYVRPVLARQAAARRGTAAALTVATRTRAARLLFDGRRVTGVATVDAQGQGRARVTARREVILCAGAVETPLLLERSGIGQPGLLREARHRARASSRRTSASASSSSAASPCR